MTSFSSFFLASEAVTYGGGGTDTDGWGAGWDGSTGDSTVR